jgi:Flp pilus assembly protein TadG
VLVEFAIVFPLLMLVIFGIIAFGSAYNNYESVRQGVRDAARQGVVGQYGSNTSCDLTGLTSANTQTRELMCLTKTLVGLGNNTRVKVLVVDAVTAPPNGALVVCAQYPQQSVNGVMRPFLGGKVLHTQVQMRIEKALDPSPVADGETAPSGGSWSWCLAS